MTEQTPAAAPQQEPRSAPEPQTQDRPLMVLVDGSSYIYRAFFAMPDLRADPLDRSSAPTGAIRGMINMLSALRKSCSAARYAACVFDAPGPTFRDAIYDKYKATRKPMEDDLRVQIPHILEAAALLGWTVLQVPGVEADDVLGTLARLAQAQGVDVLISSGDKDLAQLVTPHVTLLDTMSNKRRDEAGVLAEFGVSAAQMLDYQILVGDSVDNVPGVDGIGAKTAPKLLTQYGSLQGMIDQAQSLKGAVGANFRKALPWLDTARKLLEINSNCDLSEFIPGLPSLDALGFGEPQQEKLNDFYTRFGFRALLRKVQTKSAPASRSAAPAGPSLFDDAPAASSSALEGSHKPGLAPPPPNLEYVTIVDWSTFDEWLARINASSLTAIDTETTSLDEMTARIVGISLSVQPGQAAYIPLGHSAGPLGEKLTQLPLQEALDRLKGWLEDPTKAKLGQHIKYDRHVFANHAITVRGFAHDTMLQSYVLEVDHPHSLSSLALRHLGRRGIEYEDLCGKGARQIPFSQVPIEAASRYSCEDAEMTMAVHQILWSRLQSHERLEAIYQLEIQSSEALFEIERHGVLLDTELLRQYSSQLGLKLLELQNKAYELAGQPFNLGSPKQIGEIFFEKLALPVIKKTSTGAPSTDEEVLEKLALDYPLPARILEHRSLAKLKSTYTDKLPELVDATGRVHTHYAQAVAVTGRLSSNDPNLQNIPARTPEGRRIRQAFIAPQGCVILSCDYSQIELRIMAHISGDEALLTAFSTGQDVHRSTAAEVFGVAPQSVSDEQRRYAKVINFGLIYGMSSFGLARALNITNSAARRYIELYFERYPGVARYMDDIRETARQQGYVETVFGRRLYFPEITSNNGPRRSAAERAAINAPMQGTSADLIKMAMVKIDEGLRVEGKASKMILQVHDELVLEVPQSELQWARSALPQWMEGVAALKVPLIAQAGVGANWDEAH